MTTNKMTSEEKSKKMFQFERQVFENTLQYSHSGLIYRELIIKAFKNDPEAKALFQEAINLASN